MKVKVGDNWYSSDDMPIAIELDNEEIEQIDSLKYQPGNRYALFPKSWDLSEEQAEYWMNSGHEVKEDEISNLVQVLTNPLCDTPLWPNSNWSQDAAFIAYFIHHLLPRSEEDEQTVTRLVNQARENEDPPTKI